MAHFHLSGGASVWRLNWLADTSPLGIYNIRGGREGGIEEGREGGRGEGEGGREGGRERERERERER